MKIHSICEIEEYYIIDLLLYCVVVRAMMHGGDMYQPCRLARASEKVLRQESRASACVVELEQ